MKELIKKILKEQYILTEIAGISQEVREWSKTLKKQIDNKVKEHDNQSNGDDEPVDGVDISHFEDMGGNEYSEGSYEGRSMITTLYRYFPKEKTQKLIDYLYQNIFTIDLTNLTVKTQYGELEDEYEGIIFDIVSELLEDRVTFFDVKTDNDLFIVNENGDRLEPIYGFYQTTPLPDLMINGKDFPEQYEKFKVDKWVFKNSCRIEYDHWNSCYDGETGEYVVYFNVPLRGLSMDMFVHEIKHAYDDWNRMKKDGKPIRDTKEIRDLYTKDFENLLLGGLTKYPQLSNVIRLYYLGSKLETPAYLENEFDSPGQYKQTAKKLMNFNLNTFFNSKDEPARGLVDEFNDILINYNIPLFRKFRDVRSFLLYTKKYFNKRGDEILKRINKSQYVNKK